MARRIWCSPIPMLTVALAVGGCDSSSPTVPNSGSAAAISLIVSDPARIAQTSSAALDAGLATSLRMNEGAAYISAEPGTATGASAVEIENLRLHQTTPAELVAGGFDPVAVSAVVGDSLEIRFKLGTGGITAVRATVPARRRPRVVRTHPARGRRDVAINSVVTTIFSEPINPTTLRDSTVRLLRDGVAVRGTVRPSAGPVPGVEFVPAEALVPATTYRFVLDGRILDLSGEPLEVPEPVEFVTFAEGGTGALTVITSTAGTDMPEGYDILVDGRLAGSVGTADTVVITGLGAGQHHVLLSAMTEYCYASGGLYRQATLTQTRDATVTFNVTCTDLPELELRVTTSGVQRDEDGYDVTVNHEWSSVVPSDGTLPLRSVRYGVNVVSLSGVRGNCRDPQSLRRVVDVTPGQIATVTFSLECTPDFTPAGRIAFASYLEDGSSVIMVADADGSNRTQITSGPQDRFPVWSPDGSRIVFLRGDPWGPSRIHLVTVDGSEPGERAMRYWGDIPSLAWLPGGAELAYSHEGGNVIYVVRADNDGQSDADGDGFYDDPAREIRVTTWGGGYGLSPVDSRIASLWGRSLRIADAGGGFLREIQDDLTGAGTWDFPVWSPDGQRIAVFASRNLIEGWATTLSLEIRSATGGGTTVLPLPGSIHRPVWSPDGSTFAYTECRACQGIRYMRTDGTGTSVMISDGFDPAWKP